MRKRLKIALIIASLFFSHILLWIFSLSCASMSYDISRSPLINIIDDDLSDDLYTIIMDLSADNQLQCRMTNAYNTNGFSYAITDVSLDVSMEIIYAADVTITDGTIDSYNELGYITIPTDLTKDLTYYLRLYTVPLSDQNDRFDFFQSKYHLFLIQ